MASSFKKYYQYCFVVVLITTTVFTWFSVLSELNNELTVAFLDVGQGDAIFIQTPNNSQILVDGGQNKAVLRELTKIMPFYDRSIDVVIQTHPDSDHIGGLIEVLRRYNVDLVVESGVGSNSPFYKEIGEIIDKKEINHVLARKGMKINVDNGAYIEVLFPDREVDGIDSNDASVVLKLVYGDNSFLLMGDSPKKIERYLVDLNKDILDADVLKIGHHGSKTSTSELLLGYASPEFAIISSGEGNKYNHPHNEVLSLLTKFKIEVLRTDNMGTIVFKSDGTDIYLK